MATAILNFFTVANNRRKFNAIHIICVDGACFNDTSSMKGAIINFYEKLYREDNAGRPFLKGISYDSISVARGRSLKGSPMILFRLQRLVTF